MSAQTAFPKAKNYPVYGCNCDLDPGEALTRCTVDPLYDGHVDDCTLARTPSGRARRSPTGCAHWVKASTAVQFSPPHRFKTAAIHIVIIISIVCIAAGFALMASAIIQRQVPAESQYPKIEHSKIPGLYKVHRASNGMFYVTAVIGARKIDFLVDTGATTSVLTSKDAATIGLLYAPENASISMMTANKPIKAYTKIIPEVTIGKSLVRNLPVVIVDNQNTPSLLGQNALRLFGSVLINNDDLTLGVDPLVAQSIQQ